jgi:hypothetical protein
MNKLFKTPTPVKEFAKKIKRKSDKRRSTTICDSVVLDDDFLERLRSIPDAEKSTQHTNYVKCHSCHINKVNQKLMVCGECGDMFHPSCVVGFLDTNSNEVIKNTKCPKCNVNLGTSEMMFVYAETCTASQFDILKNDNRIRELEQQLEHVQKEVMLCKTNINKVSQQREISKRIMATVVTMIS